MLRGFRDGLAPQHPVWSGKLNNLYWVIRNERFNGAKRRRYYRLIAKEKLRLAELGINQELIKVTCRYFVELKAVHGLRMRDLMLKDNPQMELDF